MDKTLFDELLASVTEADEIIRGKRAATREFAITPFSVREIREMTSLSQEKFARLIHVQVGTLRNWEQGRRDPTGPARALLQLIRRDPRHAIEALTEAHLAALSITARPAAIKPRALRENRARASTRGVKPRSKR